VGCLFCCQDNDYLVSLSIVYYIVGLSMAIDETIIKTVIELQDIHNRVFPWMVADWMIEFHEVSCSERTARRYMATMAQRGRLDRIGQRRGYRIMLH